MFRFVSVYLLFLVLIVVLFDLFDWLFGFDIVFCVCLFDVWFVMLLFVMVCCGWLFDLLVSYFGLRVLDWCYCVVVTVVLIWLFVCVDFGLFGLIVGCLMLFNC